MPQTNNYYKSTKCNNVSSKGGHCTIAPIRRTLVNIANFNYFLVINRPNNCIALGYKNKNVISTVYCIKNNSPFSQKGICWGESRKTSYKNSPSKRCTTQTHVQAFQIPNILWPAISDCSAAPIGSRPALSIGIVSNRPCFLFIFTLKRFTKTRNWFWSVYWPKLQSPAP
jgi:hypothetical protein